MCDNPPDVRNGTGRIFKSMVHRDKEEFYKGIQKEAEDKRVSLLSVCRSRGKRWGTWGSADTCRSSTEESSCPGKPSEDGMFSPFSNTFVYPSLSLISKKNPHDNTYEFLLLTMVTPKGFGPLNPALRGLWLKPLVDGAKKKAYLIYRFSLRLSR